ncbi:D-alanyl-D-alanine carboxypeptidase/D-alanyl-D-alanine-endopeptidase [Microbacterium sp. NPDC077184]|uniref:D-alanyl-D-alanine carboxypeptidase/D-alanyl-D-alanine endopeptidase n=1 Tax=Microbacterium sp. NPDC077184 TaxID=3154764 RepID=UPI003429FCC2
MNRRGSAAAAAAVLLAAASLTACTIGGGDDDDTSSATDSAGIPDAALAVMNEDRYANSRWQIYVEDLESGDVLVDYFGDAMAEPGSFVKTYSAGAAWLEFGADSTLTTPVKASGEVVDGTLQGDLILVGQGDLTMGGRTKPDGTVSITDLDHNDANPLPGATLTPEDPLTGLNDLAEQVKASGIDSVSGDVIVDDRLFTGELVGQPVTPININQNIIDVLITPGASEGDPATGELIPAVAPWTLTVDVKTVEAGGTTALDDPVDAGDGQLTITGTIAADADPTLKVYVFDDPATFARTAFIEALERAGVAVTADPITPNPDAALPSEDEVAELAAVAELASLPLSEEVTYVMKISYNRGAQTLICRLAVAGGSKDCDDGMAVAGEIWQDAGLDTTGASLVDGSGLPGNFITAENAAQVQRIMMEGPDADLWVDTLPIMGVDGSLATVQADSEAAGKVFAKTGTLAAFDAFNTRFRIVTKTLGGVIEAESGRTLLFTVMMNNAFASPEDYIDAVFQANDDVGAMAAAIQQEY